VEGGRDADREIEGQRAVRRIEEPGRIEGSPVVADRFGVGVRALRLVGGLQGQVDGRAGVAEWEREAGVASVLGEHAVVTGPCAQRGRHPGVQLEPATGRERLVAVGAEEGVHEAELRRPAPVGHDQTGRFGLLERLQDVQQRRNVSCREQIGVEVGTERRSQIEHRPGVGTQHRVATDEPGRE